MDSSQWLLRPNPLKGVAVLGHGLNLRPSRMNDIALLLQKEGYLVYRTSLTGHSGAWDVSRLQWQKDLFSALCLSKKEAEKEKVPLIFVGYSLSTALYLDVLSQFKKESFLVSKNIFFSPAVGIKKYLKYAKFLSFMPWLIIPSRSPREYRANWGTSMEAYDALFRIEADLLKTASPRWNIPTLVFSDPEDELVSFELLEKFISEKKLNHWNVTLLPEKNRDYHHLYIDKSSAGESSWKTIQSAIAEFLSPVEKTYRR